MEKIIGHILFMLFIFLSFFNCDHKVSDKMVIKFRQVEDRYWNTKQRADSAGIPFPDSVDADSIEVARFKDGFYWVKVYTYDIRNNADSESVLVHIDNFAPRVKQTYPSDWFAFVPTKQHKIWCCFSEAMNYPIINISYIQVDSIPLYKLLLEVDFYKWLPAIFRHLGILDFRYLIRMEV